MNLWATATMIETTINLLHQQVYYVGLPLKLDFYFWNQVNLFDFKFVQKAKILIASFNGKKNNFPVPRNIAFRVNQLNHCV